MPAGSGVVTEMSAGTVTTGAVVSIRTTVIVKLFCAVFPCVSVAEQVTVVVPTGNLLPEDGLHVGVREPSTTSVADASPYVTVVPLGSLVEADAFAGGVTVGGVVSCTVTVPLCCTGVESSVVVLHVTVVWPSGKWPVTEKSPVPLVPAGVSH